MSTAKATAEYYAATIGSVLAALVPEIILTKTASLHIAPTTAPASPTNTPTRKNFFEIHAIQGDDEERYGSYRGYEDLAERLNKIGAKIETFRDM